MGWTFETMGNAIISLCQDGTSVLVTDPWLTEPAYFGSWEIERPLTEAQLTRARNANFAWFSHGHPDHFHPQSVETIERSTVILLPDQYEPELARSVTEMGFTHRVLPQKQWVTLQPGLRVMCVANENMDAILAMEVDGVLLLNKNDSPFCGEDAFFRKLVAGYKENYLFALCAFDADMINLYGPRMERVLGPPAERKPGTVWSVARTAEALGAQTFCCSSSQHVYVRPDSAWANEYRITWPDIQKLWTADKVRLIPPYSVVAIPGGTLLHTDAEDPIDPASRIRPELAEDWNATLSEPEWSRVEAFMRQFETLRAWQDFVAFTVGGETRRFYLRPSAQSKPEPKLRGVTFHLPRGSLLETVEYGYFDDLLIGNFMKTQLHGMELYPLFSPRVAKLGGNARVFTAAELWRFRLHWLRQSPGAFLRYRWAIIADRVLIPWIKQLAATLGIFGILKTLRGALFGKPKTI